MALLQTLLQGELKSPADGRGHPVYSELELKHKHAKNFKVASGFIYSVKMCSLMIANINM